MRFGQKVASRSWAAKPARGNHARDGLAVAGSVLGLGWSLSGSAAAVPLLLPMEQAFVPIAVAAAFVLPALIAVAFAGLAAMFRRVNPVLGLGVLAIAALAVVGYLNPGLIAALRI